MKLINQSAEICKTHGYTLQDIYKDIERAARVSYKSEDKITEDSAEKMVKRLINMKHYSPLEFGTVYLKMPMAQLYFTCIKYEKNQFSKTIMSDGYFYVTTNYRVIIENGWENDLQYMCKPTKHHQRRTTIKFITNRAMTHELVRHRSMSFMQESQRYCNYSKDKFNNEITFIKPCWVNISTTDSAVYDASSDGDYFIQALEDAENWYLSLLKEGWTPQQARAVLPNATKTEIYMCGFDRDWEHFFDLRDKTYVDPQMHDLAHSLHLDFIEKGRCK